MFSLQFIDLFIKVVSVNDETQLNNDSGPHKHVLYTCSILYIVKIHVSSLSH